MSKLNVDAAVARFLTNNWTRDFAEHDLVERAFREAWDLASAPPEGRVRQNDAPDDIIQVDPTVYTCEGPHGGSMIPASTYIRFGDGSAEYLCDDHARQACGGEGAGDVPAPASATPYVYGATCHE